MASPKNDPLTFRSSQGGAVHDVSDASLSLAPLKPQTPATGANAEALWKIICGVEISDVVTLTTTHPGGGGFDAEDFFVEGVRPGGATLPDLTLELDVSPRAYYTTSPF